MIKKYRHSIETRKKIGDALRRSILFQCDFCKKNNFEKPNHFNRSLRHFCDRKCYAAYREKIMPPHEQHAWKGGVSLTESHRRWKKKNPGRMAHLKARRSARERGAEGSHNYSEWLRLKALHSFKCAFCKQSKPLTKDHIIPLSENGSDYIANIQPLCRNCNSKKWKKLKFKVSEILAPCLR